eukprot:scaffold29009_cov51-Isochrysis_galbana.AAC.1
MIDRLGKTRRAEANTPGRTAAAMASSSAERAAVAAAPSAERVARKEGEGSTGTEGQQEGHVCAGG